MDLGGNNMSVFTNCNKYTTLLGDIANRGGYVHIGAEGIWEISVPFPQLFCEQNDSLHLKKKKKKTITSQAE